MVDLDVRLQRAKGDITVSDPALEQEMDIPGVVGPSQSIRYPLGAT